MPRHIFTAEERARGTAARLAKYGREDFAAWGQKGQDAVTEEGRLAGRLKLSLRARTDPAFIERLARGREKGTAVSLERNGRTFLRDHLRANYDEWREAHSFTENPGPATRRQAVATTLARHGADFYLRLSRAGNAARYGRRDEAAP